MIIEEMVRVAAEAIYNLDPIMDQPVDLDGRPTGPAGKIPWSALPEIDAGYHEHYKNSARAGITAALAAMWQDGYAIIRRELTEESIDLLDYNLFNDDNEGFWEALMKSQGVPAPTQLSTRMGSEKIAEG